MCKAIYSILFPSKSGDHFSIHILDNDLLASGGHSYN